MSDEKFRIVVVLLAAGFGTRLGDLGENTPKGLIQMKNGETLLGKMVKDLVQQDVIKRICLITNGKFFKDYEGWLKREDLVDQVEIFSNNVMQPVDRNGALKDLSLSIKHFKLEKENVLVCTSDTFYNFNFVKFIKFIRKNSSKFITTLREVKSVDEIRGRLGCVEVDGDRIVSFIEKPENPKSMLAGIPFYYYPSSYQKLLEKYLSESNIPDAPGNIVGWLLKNDAEVCGYMTEGEYIDVGTPVDLEKLQKINDN